MVCTFEEELVNCHVLYVIFCVFQNRSISFSHLLNLLRNRSGNHVFSIMFAISSNYSRNVQLLTLLNAYILSSNTRYCQRLIIGNNQYVTIVLFNEQHQQKIYSQNKYMPYIIGNIHVKKFQPITMFQLLILMIYLFNSNQLFELESSIASNVS